MQQRARFDQANRLRVRQQVERKFARHAAIEQFVLRGPRVVHRALVNFARARIPADQHRRDVVRRTRIGERQQRPRTRHHAMALILAIGGVADLFRET